MIVKHLSGDLLVDVLVGTITSTPAADGASAVAIDLELVGNRPTSVTEGPTNSNEQST